MSESRGAGRGARDADPLLTVANLTAGFDIQRRFVPAVINVSFDISPGETLCIVGESGSGKSVTALSIIRLVPPPGRIAAGTLSFGGQDLMKFDEREMQRVRGAEIGFVFQEPMTALNPVMTIGSQIEETLRVHDRATRRTARAKAVELLDSVSVPEPQRRVVEYPHQLSGGLRQRALIAMALACEPKLLIADEPTTALDVTIQAQILDLLRTMQKRLGLALLLITHDLGVVAEMADRVCVMYAGRIVEHAPGEGIVRGSEASIHEGTAWIDPRRRARNTAACHRGHRARRSDRCLPAARSRPDAHLGSSRALRHIRVTPFSSTAER